MDIAQGNAQGLYRGQHPVDHDGSIALEYLSESRPDINTDQTTGKPVTGRTFPLCPAFTVNRAGSRCLPAVAVEKTGRATNDAGDVVVIRTVRVWFGSYRFCEPAGNGGRYRNNRLSARPDLFQRRADIESESFVYRVDAWHTFDLDSTGLVTACTLIIFMSE